MNCDYFFKSFYPIQYIFVACISRSNVKSETDHVVIERRNMDSVHLQERQHDIHADPFVSVDKSVVRDKRKTQLRCFFFL